MRIVLMRERFADLFVFFFMTIAMQQIATAHEFDTRLLKENGRDISIDELKNIGNLPGFYYLDIYLNDEFISTERIYVANEAGNLVPCIGMDVLKKYKLKANRDTKPNIQECITINSISKVSYFLNLKKNILQIQDNSKQPSTPGVNKEKFEDGDTAFIVNYNISRYNSKSPTSNVLSESAYINPGININEWRLRSELFWNKSEGGWKEKNGRYYATRGLYEIDSRISFGDIATPGPLYAVTAFKGVKIESDQDIDPKNKFIKSSFIRGVARTNARLNIFKNGSPVYTQVVPPGEFELKDTPFNLNSNEYTAELVESDGEINRLVNFYQPPPILLPKEAMQYNLAAGKIESGKNSNPFFIQGSYLYGINNTVTFLSAGQFSRKYQSLLAGLGKSLDSSNSISMEGVLSKNSSLHSDRNFGGMMRIKYNTSLYKYGLNILTTAETGSRYFSSISDDFYDVDQNKNATIRHNFSLNLSFPIQHEAQIYLNGGRSMFWGGNFDSYLSAGLSIAKKSFVSSVSVNQTASNLIKKNQIQFYLSLPLDKARHFAAQVKTYKSSNVSENSYQLNGIGFNENHHWLINSTGSGILTNRDQTRKSFSTNYTGEHGGISGLYENGRDFVANSIGLNGMVILDRKGLIFGQYHSGGGGVVVIDPVEENDVTIYGSRKIEGSRSWFAVDSGVTPYVENKFMIKAKKGGEFENSIKKITPTDGAVIHIGFHKKPGLSAIVKLTKLNGEAVPFGAKVRAQDRMNVLGAVGDGGFVYLSGLSEENKLLVSWSDGGCITSLHINEKDKIQKQDSLVCL